LLSAVLAGSALVAFGVVAWRLIYAAAVHRLDAKLESQVIRATRPRIQGQWQTFEASLPSELGIDTDTPIALLVLDLQGKILYQSKNWSPEFNATQLLSPPLATESSPKPYSLLSPAIQPGHSSDGTAPNPQVVTQQTAIGNWRIGAVRFPPAQAIVAVSLQTIDQEMRVIRNIFLLVTWGTLLLVAGGAWGLSGSVLRPIRQLTTAIRRVTVTGLDQQVPIGATDVEFVELIQVFNQMLSRLGRSFRQASRFSADAAHELKTPLAILQGELEQTLQQAEPGSEMQQSLSNLLDEVRRLSEIVRKLLLLSLADAGQMSLNKVEVNVSEILSVMAEDMELLAPHLHVQTDIADNLQVRGDLDLLTQVLKNLMSNAIKYNLPNGWINIQGQQKKNIVQITITNASNPIPVNEQQRIFDRFYRGDPARTRKIEGVGLGLSLSREIARAHNGDLALDTTSDPRSHSIPGSQTAFTLTLPAKE
jgi:signal transduction histidine kinase